MTETNLKLAYFNDLDWNALNTMKDKLTKLHDRIINQDVKLELSKVLYLVVTMMERFE